MAEPTRCGCPAPNNTMSSQGECTTCHVEGPNRQKAIQAALAAGNARPALEDARQQGILQGYAKGREVGRAEAIEALVPSFREPEPELEAG